ncbi:beta-xylosidase [Streptomyces sp. L2]|uniref:beta-xylosidase n=1 Tax=Streptomyces sp. L2 TaxID=2162665 RepID=UPI0013E91CD1|nr:beta-xylosidase [Streptomyces sp. L2]
MADSAYDYAPTVMLDGVYKMWWCGQDPAGKVPGDDILYAESSSPDGPFHARGSTAPHQIVFEGTGNGSFDNEHTCDPSVVRVNGTYYMYYGALRHDTDPLGTTIGVASSPDGIHWTRLNSGQAIINPAKQQNTGNNYGAGQPSAIYLDGKFYLMFTDTTGAGALGNGAGQFVWRSSDPTFQSGVEVFTASGWRAKTDANSRSFLVVNGFSVDWQYSDALGAFIVANDGPSAAGTVLHFLDRNDLRVHPYADGLVPGTWTEGPGIVSRPDKHSLASTTNDCGRIPVDVMRSTTTFPPRQLAHIGLDLLSGTSCASMPASQIAALYEGYGLQAPGLPAAVVVDGRRLQIENIAAYGDLTHNAIAVPPSVYNAVPYGASLHDGQAVLGSPGLPAAFNLDKDTLWPISCLKLITDNHSAIGTVDRETWLSHPTESSLYCLS